MVLFPKSGLGRFLLLTIIISTLFYVVLNLSSFGGSSWIIYVSIDYTFGLWTICDTTPNAGSCAQWTSTIKPSFVRSSQGLEVVALVFYIVAAGLIIVGILNTPGISYELPFLGAAGLLFISIIFIAASLGLMSNQGRASDPYAYMGWSWWTGLVGLIMTLICFLTLIGLFLDMKLSATNSMMTSDPTKQGSHGQHHHLHNQPSHPMAMGANAPPIIPGNHYQDNTYNYSHGGHYPQHDQQYSHHGYPSHYDQQYSHHGHYPQHDPYSQQHYPNSYYQDPMMMYGNHSPAEHYFHDHSSPGMYADLAQQYGSPYDQGHYQGQYPQPYNHYTHQPQIFHDYF